MLQQRVLKLATGHYNEDDMIVIKKMDKDIFRQLLHLRMPVYNGEVNVKEETILHRAWLEFLNKEDNKKENMESKNEAEA